MLRTSLLTDSSTSATQIIIDYDGIDSDSGCNGGFDRKSTF